MSRKVLVYEALHGGPATRGMTPTQKGLVLTIFAGVGLAIVETEPDLSDHARFVLDIAECGVGGIFLAEYLARLWCVGLEPEHRGVSGRLRYLCHPVVILDLIALVPFFLGILGAESLVLRLVRVLRIFALAKMVRYSAAIRLVLRSLVSRRYELAFAVCLAGMMILISSAALYVVEGDRQPKAFGSILRSMWWAVVTLTTVGYGDVVPQTPLGKVLAGITALGGIGMIALPTGILAAAFSDGFASARAAAASFDGPPEALGRGDSADAPPPR